MQLLFDQFVIEESGGRVTISFPRDWLKAQAENPDSTSARNLFFALGELARTGAGSRVLKPQEFARIMGIFSTVS